MVSHAGGLGVDCVREAYPDQGTERLPKRDLIGRGQSSQLLEHKGRVDSRDNRFEDGRLGESRTLPILELDLTPGQRGGRLTGDRHDEKIWTCLMVRRNTDHDGRTAFDR